jgi:uncharacterized protein YndB with AHSA1/START domain
VTTIESSVTIGRPIDIVFGFFADPRNEPRWIEGFTDSEKTTPGPIGVGTRFRQRAEKGDIEYEVTAFVPGKSWSFRVVDDSTPFALSGSQRFEGDDRGTRVTWSYDVTPKGTMARLALPVFRVMAARRNDSRLLLARDLLEQRSIRPPA